MSILATPVKVGAWSLRNRCVMASLTRNRCPNTVPDQVNLEYYAQRASAGLILTEGTLIEPQGTEWPDAPGIWSRTQVNAWKKITDAVHNKGGLILCQLWHTGRVSHPLHQSGRLPPSASAVSAKGGKFRLLLNTPGYTTPCAIEDPMIYVEMYCHAAKMAKEAGFDGVELHSANGYLPSQFLDSGSNVRTDGWGGDYIKRCKFPLTVLDALIEVWGADRVGVKLSPAGGYNDMGMPHDETVKQFTFYIQEIVKRKLAYVQLLNYIKFMDAAGRGTEIDNTQFRPLFANSKTATFYNGGYDGPKAAAIIEGAGAEAIVFGNTYISNPDLFERVTQGKELAKSDYHTYYEYEKYPYDKTNRFQGYTDYPNAAGQKVVV